MRLGNHQRGAAAHHRQHQGQDPIILLALAEYLVERAAPTARATGGAAPRPAGRATPGPDCKVEEMPPVVDLPSRVLGSAGGGDSTDKEIMCAPRTIVRPSVRFSSCTIACAAPEAAPGAAGLFCFLMRRNSSVSARTTFMCCEDATLSVTSNCISWLRGSYLVKSQHLAGHLAAIVQSDSHPVVDLRRRASVSASHVGESWSQNRIEGLETMNRCCTYVAGLRYHLVLAC